MLQVVPETADTATFELDVPDDLTELFAYRPGQFCTFRVTVDGVEHLRSYSMSSTPGIDQNLAVTVKRVPGGVVSNWLLDQVQAGDHLEAVRPSGTFCLADRSTSAIVALCGGSGVTPVLSLVKAALAGTDRPVHVLYANRHGASVIFADAWARLVARYPDRLRLVHHLDSDAGLLDQATVGAFVAGLLDGDFYICGPAPFMDLAEQTVRACGAGTDQIFIERFGTSLADPAVTPEGTDGTVPHAPVSAASGGADTADAAGNAASCAVVPASVAIVLKGRTTIASYRTGDTILETARRAGLNPPFSCEAGNCATCMAILRQGQASMRVNDALTDDEVAQGWVLTCQAIPVGSDVVVEYEEL